MAIMESKKVKIVIPCYRERLTKSEKISLLQCKRILHNYPLCIIKPSNLFLQIEEMQGIETEEFEQKWFQSVQTYNDLMLTPQFYERFCDYEYILIYQLDAFVFRDELSFFCSMGYDYIGAPWLYGQFIYVNDKGGYYYVGNGGFSLRKVRSHLDILEKTRVNDIVNEDMFFSSREQEGFRVAPLEIALKFAFEATVRKCYERNGMEMPFGCHAWQKYDFSFYQKVFQEFGYDTTDIKDEKFDKDKYNDFGDLSKLDERIFKEALLSVLPKTLNEIWIWGAGQIGRECGWLLQKNHVEIKGYIDSNEKMKGTYLYTKRVMSAFDFFERDDETPIIIAMAEKPKEIVQTLKEHHKVEGKDYTSWKRFRRECHKLIER